MNDNGTPNYRSALVTDNRTPNYRPAPVKDNEKPLITDQPLWMTTNPLFTASQGKPEPSACWYWYLLSGRGVIPKGVQKILSQCANVFVRRHLLQFVKDGNAFLCYQVLHTHTHGLVLELGCTNCHVWRFDCWSRSTCSPISVSVHHYNITEHAWCA